MSKRLIILVVALLLLSACQTVEPMPTPSATNTASPSPTFTVTPSATPTSTNTPEPTDTPTPKPTLPPQAIGPTGFPDNVNPLTGLVPEDPGLLNRRPIAIKIQLFPRGQRPAWGISQADIVYDYIQNFGMTRLFTIFYANNPEKVGPIRSARLLDGTLVKTYQSIYAFGSADGRILYNLQTSYGIASRLIYEGAQTCPVLCREDPNGYNFLIANLPAFAPFIVERGIPNERPNLDGMNFEYSPPPNGAPGEQVSLRYSISAYVRWEYDPQSGRYLRFQDTQEAGTREAELYAPFIDGATEEQVGADNVVLLFVPHMASFGTVPGPNEVLDIQLTGIGKAIAFRDGMAYADGLQWRRQDGSVLYLTTADGKPYPFKHGNTWFQVVGTYSTIDNPTDSTWRIEHR